MLMACFLGLVECRTALIPHNDEVYAPKLKKKYLSQEMLTACFLGLVECRTARIPDTFVWHTFDQQHTFAFRLGRGYDRYRWAFPTSWWTIQGTNWCVSLTQFSFQVLTWQMSEISSMVRSVACPLTSKLFHTGVVISVRTKLHQFAFTSWHQNSSLSN